MNILYIDADNISYKCMKEIKLNSKFDSLHMKKIYGDWSKPELKNWANLIYDYGLETIQCFRIGKKQSTDIKLITDLVEDIHLHNNISNIYLISSDSDFTYLCQLIKKKNINLTVLSPHDSILKNYCNNFIILNQNNNLKDLNILFQSIGSSQIMLLSKFQKNLNNLNSEKLNREKLIKLIDKYTNNFLICTVEKRKKYIINISDFENYNSKTFLDNKEIIINNYKNIFQILYFEDLYDYLFTDSHI